MLAFFTLPKTITMLIYKNTCFLKRVSNLMSYINTCILSFKVPANAVDKWNRQQVFKMKRHFSYDGWVTIMKML